MTKLYSLYDSCAKFYHSPFTCLNDQDAIRGVSEAVNSSNPSQLSQSPGDFTLFDFGTFDPQTGVIVLNPTPVRLCVCNELKAPKFSGVADVRQ